VIRVEFGVMISRSGALERFRVVPDHADALHHLVAKLAMETRALARHRVKSGESSRPTRRGRLPDGRAPPMCECVTWFQACAEVTWRNTTRLHW